MVALAKWYFWQHDFVAKWCFGKMIFWQHDFVAKQYFGKMICWQNDALAKWYFGKMTLWQNDYLWIHGWPLSKQTHCSKQTVLQIGFKKTARNNWMGRRTKPKVFDLHRNKQQQEHREANGPPGARISATKPGFDLLIQLRRIVRCAKGGARLGCVLSSRVPGRRDAAVHEHALKSCAAHTGFPCKDRSAKLELEIFGHENHVSWSFFLSAYVAW